ncbi:MAG: hypothetical protein HC905_10730 [Bacteroidales bacterium]|nr:hypothetical protein [Bacteroidales bacterium]
MTSLYDAQILDEASNESEIDKITSWTKADIIFMDVMMPGKMVFNSPGSYYGNITNLMWLQLPCILTRFTSLL